MMLLLEELHAAQVRSARARPDQLTPAVAAPPAYTLLGVDTLSRPPLSAWLTTAHDRVVPVATPLATA